MPRWLWILKRAARRLWVRATLIGALGIAAAILAAVVDRYIPWKLPANIGADAVDSILGIIASSMLTVSAFSISVMTAALGSATNNVTPRATKLLIEDRLTQTVLSTFVGSFLFGIVGIVVLKTGAYGERGRFILFAVTIGVIALIVVSLLRWIDHLTQLGRVGETTDRVEGATRQAIEARLEEPCLGGTPLNGARPGAAASGLAVTTDAVGYVQHVDMPALMRCAEKADADIRVAVLPGAFVYPDTPLAWIGGPEAGEDVEGLRRAIGEAFSIGSERSFDQDPRFGLAVLSEIASRALSPAVNDAGTAIDVIGRTTRLLSLWAKRRDPGAAQEVRYPRVHVPPLRTADLFEDGFMLIARDGAGMIEVQLRLRKALLALSRIGDADFRAAALAQAQMAHERAAIALTLEADKARLRDIPRA